MARDRRGGVGWWFLLSFLMWGAGSTIASELAVEPAAMRLEGWRARGQLVVTARAKAGAVEDKSGVAVYRVEPADLADVSGDGAITPLREGEGEIVVENEGRTVRVKLVVAGKEASAKEALVSYRHEVGALLSRAGCNMGACHGNLSGKGGFKLSLRGEDLGFDLLALTRELQGRRLDLVEPGNSLMVRKPLGQLPHEGGTRFSPGSFEAQTLSAWIGQGARDDRKESQALRRVRIFPEVRIVEAPGLRQQLRVTAEFEGGQVRDVTHLAAFDVDDPSKAEVTPGGQVVMKEPGEVAVAVRYLDGRAVSRLAFLQDSGEFAWRGPEPANLVDEQVFAKLKSLRINPSAGVSDDVFLRRVYLDTIGTLPTPEEARRFLGDASSDRRARLIDELLARPEFSDFWALKWADLLRNEEKTMGAKGVWIFQRWLRDLIERDVPLDEMVRMLVTGRGSSWANPEASFYRTNRDPEAAAEAVGQVFLGIRLQCARCHNHPFNVWTQEDYYGLTAYFTNLGRKQVNNQRRDQLDTHEINSDEIIFLSGKPGRKHPNDDQMMEPKPPGGPSPELGGDPDALDDLADWLTRGNRQFSLNMANRVWFHLMGRGIVDPVDDFRESNPASNPALLEALADELERGEYRLRPLARLILNSATYQLSCDPDPSNAADMRNFARATIKLLPAEVLLDAVGAALGRAVEVKGLPSPFRAIQYPGVRSGVEFLEVFGKPERLLTCECERSEETTLAQAFQLINGEVVRECLGARENRVGWLLQSGKKDNEILEELYLATLSRLPKVAEASQAGEYVAVAQDRRQAWEDVMWALINSKEFLLRH